MSHVTESSTPSEDKEKIGLSDRISELEEKVNKKAGRDLPKAILVGVLLAAIVIGTLLLGKGYFVLVAIAVSLVATWEFIRALKSQITRVPAVPLYFSAIFLPIAAWAWELPGLWFAFIACALFVFMYRYMLGSPHATHEAATTAWAVVYIPLFLSTIILILEQNNGVAKVLVFLGLVVANDTFAYATGVFLGKHALSPNISPNKSWEGFFGAFIGASALGLVLGLLFLEFPWWVGLIFGALIVVGATLGDLVESAIKRELGIKDMGKTLPGHGGVLDRIDSILVAAPIAYLVFAVSLPFVSG